MHASGTGVSHLNSYLWQSHASYLRGVGSKPEVDVMNQEITVQLCLKHGRENGHRQQIANVLQVMKVQC